MNIDVGDLVSIRQHRSDLSELGIVIKKHNSNRGLEKSKHANHIVDSLPPIFYVYSEGNSSQGPYLHSDLLLQQSYDQNQIVT